MAYAVSSALPRGGEARLFFSRLFQRLGVHCSYFVGLLGIATYELGMDAFGISALMLLGNLSIVVGNAVAGPVVDRFGPKATLVRSLLVMVAVFLVNALVLSTFAVLCVVMAAWSLLTGVLNTAYKTLPPYLVVPDRYQSANGLLALADNIALVAGPLLGGAVTLVFPVRAVFFVATAFTLVAWGVVLRMTLSAAGTDVGPGKADAPERHGLGYVLEGFSVTFRTPALLVMFCMCFFGFFCYGAFDSLESLFYRDVLNVSVDWLGWLVAALGVGSVVGSVGMMAAKGRAQRLVSLHGAALMLLVTGLGSWLYVGTSNVWCAAAGQVVTGFGFAFLDPTITMLAQERTDLSVTGRVISTISIGGQCAGILPLFVAPFLAEAFGVQPVLVGASIISTLVGLGFLVCLPRGFGHEKVSE